MKSMQQKRIEAIARGQIAIQCHQRNIESAREWKKTPDHKKAEYIAAEQSKIDNLRRCIDNTRRKVGR